MSAIVSDAPHQDDRGPASAPRALGGDMNVFSVESFIDLHLAEKDRNVIGDDL